MPNHTSSGRISSVHGECPWLKLPGFNLDAARELEAEENPTHQAGDGLAMSLNSGDQVSLEDLDLAVGDPRIQRLIS